MSVYVCVAVVVAVHRHVAVSVACPLRPISAALLSLRAASTRPATSQPARLQRPATAHPPLAAAAHHRVRHVRRVLGRLDLGAILDSFLARGRQHSVLAVIGVLQKGAGKTGTCIAHTPI